MAVSFDATEFKRRIVALRTGWLKTNVPNSIAVMSAAGIALQMRNKYRALARIQYRWDTQVGITYDKFTTATSEIARLGEAEFGALNLRAMGGAADIQKIAGVRGLWHGGSGNAVPLNSKGNPFPDGLTGYQAFETKLLTNPSRVARLAGLRDQYWGTKVPQWIHLEWGDDGSPGSPGGGVITPPGNALGYTKDPKYVFQRWSKSVRDALRALRI